MSTVYSTVATLEYSPAVNTLMAPNVCRGKIRAIAGSYTAASLADASTIYLAKAYMGDVLLLGGSWIGSEDNLGSGVTVAVGDTDDTDTADADRYLEATALATAAIIQFNDATACLSKVPYAIQKECWFTCTTADEATGDIRFELLVSTNN